MLKPACPTPIASLLKTVLALLILTLPWSYASAQNDTPTKRAAAPTPHAVDLVIALDVSGSMSGLIDSAKQRLWDVVNELGRAQPQPRLRVAIITYGDPAYGAEIGFVRINQPFTSDLDAVNETLFSFGTNGGDEFVARVVDTSLKKLNWSNKGGALQVLFVAGNEAADQDPEISVLQATRSAAARGIVVNTIYCGPEGDGLSAVWRDVAHSTNGLFASIDQDAGAVANIATPMDDELVALNQALNETYIAYGKDGHRYRKNQRDQDANAGAMSQAAAASRTVAKASKLYEAANWDLVDAVKAGAELDTLDEEELPAEMQAMNDAERRDYVAGKSAKRKSIQQAIGRLSDERREYLRKERAKEAGQGQASLDEALKGGLRSLAEKKGFTFRD